MTYFIWTVDIVLVSILLGPPLFFIAFAPLWDWWEKR